MALHTFEIVKPGSDAKARSGLLKFHRRNEIQTPALLAIASKGFIPHLTPDNLQGETAIQAIHAGFEDFAHNIPEQPLHFSFPCQPTESPLRTYTCLPESPVLILGPRRAKPVTSNGSNTYTSLNITTSVGHRQLEITSYLEAITRSRPDAIIAPIDVESKPQAPGIRRREKMVEISTAWLRSFARAIREARDLMEMTPSAWVPLIPLEAEVQTSYLQQMSDLGPLLIDGIVIYDVSSTSAIPENLRELPLISLTDVQTPHHILQLVSMGVDLVAAPFVTAASDAGIAFDFKLSINSGVVSQPLGFDLWLDSHTTDIRPLTQDCTCYACKNHHRAYIRHLLSAKEMLAWTLLQVHNHHIIDQFFRDIRQSIAKGHFSEDVDKFTRAYQPELPLFHGQGPRLRGYQAFSGANSTKLNTSAFQKLGRTSSPSGSSTERMANDKKEKTLESQESGVISPGLDAAILEDLGFANLYNDDNKG